MIETMTDHELISATRPPAAMAYAFLHRDEAGMEQLLELLFACHLLIDDPDLDKSMWYQCDHSFNLEKLYRESNLTDALKSVAPTWEDAKCMSERWLKEWRHDCGEYDWWILRRDELNDPSAIAYFKEMMIMRFTHYHPI